MALTTQLIISDRTGVGTALHGDYLNERGTSNQYNHTKLPANQSRQIWKKGTGKIYG
jgi:hypothetical protein